jgi:hypothetical protein
LSRRDQSTQRALWSNEVVLSDDLVERARPQQLSQRRRLTQTLGDGVVKE